MSPGCQQNVDSHKKLQSENVNLLNSKKSVETTETICCISQTCCTRGHVRLQSCRAHHVEVVHVILCDISC